MNPIQNARLQLAEELELPPALRRFGSGWLSGVIGLVLGFAGFLLVLSLRAPGSFSMPEITRYQGHAVFRTLLWSVLIGAFGLGSISLILRRSKALGTCGIGFALLATLMGGSGSTASVADPTPLYLGLDFFVLNVLFTGFLFVPLERMFALRPEQRLFRTEWREDLFYYLVSSLFVQLLTFLTFLPANWLVKTVPLTPMRRWVSGLPFLVQLVSIMFLTDLVQYWVHRTFHRVPRLWRFHAVHHSARSMDWMAGARMHFLEILVLRSATVIPMFALGFATGPVNAYIFLVYLYSTFIHANIHWRLPWIEKVLVTPRFHHWHHGIEDEALDVNYAIHFPLLDRLFKTHHLPGDRWPSGYGVQGHPVPKGYVPQWKYPFRND